MSPLVTNVGFRVSIKDEELCDSCASSSFSRLLSLMLWYENQKKKIKKGEKIQRSLSFFF